VFTRQHGQPIVLIHGLGGSAEATYGDVIERLQPEMRVLAFDNRGVGASDQATGGYALVNLAHDTRELMREVGIEHAHIVGGHNSPLENPDAFAQHIHAFVREKEPVTR
jgi:pimeloyl-ACP methyl ester carboxylesterase